MVRTDTLAIGLLAVLSASTLAASAQGGDMNCSDFSTWREAQDFFEQAGPGDPHRLDRDGDGIACEGLRDR